MSDPIDCLAFQASLSCNSGTREPAPVSSGGTRTPQQLDAGFLAAIRHRLSEGTAYPSDLRYLLEHMDWQAAELRKATAPLHPPLKHLLDDGATFVDQGGSGPLSQFPANVQAIIRQWWDAETDRDRLKEQLADADRTLAGFTRAVREARECIEDVRRHAATMHLAPAKAIVRLCEAWLNPPIAGTVSDVKVYARVLTAAERQTLAALPPARVVTREEGGP